MGILLLDKPVGLSSNAALQRVRRLADRIKAGHCGSLDPLASGMLPICLGEATRLAGDLLQGRKAYRFHLRLGERSATGDAEGQIVERAPVPSLTDAGIAQVLARFIGPQTQVPPMYSALKRDGTPLYRLARAGFSVAREPRPIRIDVLTCLGMSGGDLELRTLCSKGTYVRVLAEDIARALGSCGRLSSLRREYVEPFQSDALVDFDVLEAAPVQAWPLLSPDRAVAHLPSIRLDNAQTRALRCGQSIALPQAPEGRCRLYDPAGAFLGLGSGGGGWLRVQRLFSAPLPL